MVGRSGPPEDPAEAAEAAEAEAAIDVAGLRRWVTCVCVVNFDVDYGQIIEYQCPHGSLTEEEATSLCYMSFPDSHATSLGDTEFVFRVRRSAPAGAPPNAWRPSAQPGDEEGSGEAAPFEDATHSKRYLFGYTFFRQAKDARHRRGTFQKSIVVVSTLPYVRLFRAVARLIAPAYFGGGRPALARATSEIGRWPAPDGGCALELPLVGRRIRCRLCVMSMQLGALQKRILSDAARAASTAASRGADADASGLDEADRPREAGDRLGASAGASPPSVDSPPPSPRARDRPPPPLRTPPQLGGSGGEGLRADARAHAPALPPQAREPWAEVDGKALSARTRSTPVARALADRLPARPSLGDALSSAIDSFAPFQDISLLRAFSPPPHPLARGVHRPAARGAAGADARAASPAASAPGASGSLDVPTAPVNGRSSPTPAAVAVGLGAIGAFGGNGVQGGAAPAYEAIWTYWELVLTGASILVHSHSPTRCSDAVLALVSLLAPIPFCGDFRPYFTIHDGDFERYATSANEPPPAADGSGRGVILGVTNPYFLKMRQPWHALIALDASDGLLTTASPSSNLEGIVNRAAGGSVAASGKARRLPVVVPDAVVLKQLTDVLDADVAAPARRTEPEQPPARRAGSDLSAVSRAAALTGGGGDGRGGGRGGGAGGTSDGSPPGAPSVQRAATMYEDGARVHTPSREGVRTPPLPPSCGVTGGSSGGPGGGSDGSSVSASAHKIANELLRQHFRELTAKFLRPLEVYGTRGFVPPHADWARPVAAAGGAAGGAPGAWMASFDRDRFLKELWVTEPAPLPRNIISRRADLVKLYEAFLDTPHFRLWWHERRSEALRTITHSYREKLATQAARGAHATTSRGGVDCEPILHAQRSDR